MTRSKLPSDGGASDGNVKIALDGLPETLCRRGFRDRDVARPDSAEKRHMRISNEPMYYQDIMSNNRGSILGQISFLLMLLLLIITVFLIV